MCIYRYSILLCSIVLYKYCEKFKLTASQVSSIRGSFWNATPAINEGSLYTVYK